MVFFKSFHQLIRPGFVSWITSTNTPENISDATYVVDERFYLYTYICRNNKPEKAILTYHTFIWVVYSQSALNKHCSLQYASFASSSNSRFRSIIQSPPSKKIYTLVERSLSGIENIELFKRLKRALNDVYSYQGQTLNLAFDLIRLLYTWILLYDFFRDIDGNIS